MKRFIKVLLILAIDIAVVTFIIFAIGKVNNSNENVSSKLTNLEINEEKIEEYKKHIKDYENKKGTLYSEKLEYAIFSNENFVPIRKNAKWSYINSEGKMLSDFIYVEAREFSNGLAAVKLHDKFGFIDETGKIVIDYMYDDVGEFLENDMATVAKNGKCGVIDKNGKIVLDFIYEDALNLGSKQYWLVKLQEGYTFYNLETNQIEGLFFDNIEKFSDGLAAVEKDGKWGYVDEKGNLIIQYKYEKASDFSSGYAIVEENEKKGIIDASGKWQKTLDIEEYGELSEDRVAVKNEEKYVFVDLEGKPITNFEYEDYNIFYDGLAAVQVDEKWGFINKDGEIVIDCVFSEVGYFYNDIANVKFEDKWGFIDKNGNVIIDFQYEYSYVSTFNENDVAFAFDNHLNFGFINKKGELIIGNLEPSIADIEMSYIFSDDRFITICVNDKWGVIDRNGNEIIPCEYEYSISYYEDRAIVEKDDQFACFDELGNIIIELGKYDDIDYFNEERSIVENDGKYGIIDKMGNLITPIEYDDIKSFRDGIAIVEKDEKYGIIDKNGNIIVPIEYNEIASFEGNTTFAEKGGMYGYINKKGEIVGDFKYLEAYDFCEGLSIAFLEDGYVYLDENAEIAIPYKYDDASEFKNGIASVIYNGEEIFINKKGEKVDLPKTYNTVYIDNDIESDLIVVELDDKYGCINKEYQEVVECIYDKADTEFNEYGLIRVKKDDKWGIINEEGTLIVDLKYDEIGEFSEGLSYVKKDNLYGYIDINGNEIIECQYLSVQDFSSGLAYVCEKYTQNTKCNYYIDKNNNKVIDVSAYFVGFPFNGDIAMVSQVVPVHEVGYIDRQGNVVIGNFEN